MSKRVLGWSLLAVAGVFFVLAVLWLTARYSGLSDEQRDALAIMQLPPAEGENAFPLLWLLQYDVPEEDMAKVMAKDVQRFSRQPIGANFDDDRWGETSAADEYAFLGLNAEQAQLICRGGHSDCLDRVRQNQQAVADLISDRQDLLRRLDKLRSTDYYRSSFPPRLDMPLPAFQPAFFSATQHALWFVEGRVDEALAGVCQDIATWRRLASGADSLIVQMIGIAYSSDANGRLMAQMLAELPLDQPLPQVCAIALAAPADEELSLCNALRGEYAFMAGSIDFVLGANPDDYWHRLIEPLVLNRETFLVDQARALEPACREATKQAIAADQRDVSLTGVDTGLLRWRCVDNIAGCVLLQIGQPHYSDYLARVQDHAARLRLLATLAWLRDQPEISIDNLGQRLAQRPDWMQSPTREITLGPGGKTLQIQAFESSRGEVLELPLPVAMLESMGSRES